MSKDIETVEQRTKIVQDYLIKNGWTIDKWGHARKTYDRGNGMRDYRYKFLTNVMRYEVSAPDVGWVRIRSLNLREVALQLVKGGRL